MDEPQSNSTVPGRSRRRLLLVVGLGLLATGVVGAWFYHVWFGMPLPPVTQRPSARPIAVLNASTQRASGPAAQVPNQPAPSSSSAAELPRSNVDSDPLAGFRANLKKDLLIDLSGEFPNLADLLNDQEGERDNSRYGQAALRLIDAAQTAPSGQQPVMLFAADLVAGHIQCEAAINGSKSKADCATLRQELAARGVALKYSELGGGFYYTHELLWKLWQEHAQSAWGERAFVLLLDSGWDTSKTCEKGSDQTREVIRQGEAFLLDRPASPYRTEVVLLVAEAYASWWSLANEPAGSDMFEYVDPARFRDGAQTARTRAIADFEQIVNLAPNTSMGEYSAGVAAQLRQGRVLDNYKFFCVYD